MESYSFKGKNTPKLPDTATNGTTIKVIILYDRLMDLEDFDFIQTVKTIKENIESKKRSAKNRVLESKPALQSIKTEIQVQVN